MRTLHLPGTAVQPEPAALLGCWLCVRTGAGAAVNAVCEGDSMRMSLRAWLGREEGGTDPEGGSQLVVADSAPSSQSRAVTTETAPVQARWLGAGASVD